MRKLMLFVAALVFSVGTAFAQPDLKPNHPDRYTVVKGDTLWDIASGINSDETGEIVERIKKLNPGVFSDSTTIQPGQLLTVPAN